MPKFAYWGPKKGVGEISGTAKCEDYVEGARWGVIHLAFAVATKG